MVRRIGSRCSDRRRTDMVGAMSWLNITVREFIGMTPNPPAITVYGRHKKYWLWWMALTGRARREIAWQNTPRGRRQYIYKGWRVRDQLYITYLEGMT